MMKYFLFFVCLTIVKFGAAFDIISAKIAAFNVTNLIYQRFEFHNQLRYQFFLGSMNLNDYTWDILKYKFCHKIISGNSSFLMLFGGSSVTAGHDNYFHQAYPAVFDRRMKPIFDQLGVNLQSRNIAMGANQCRPFDQCYNAMGGENADWIGWEQAYNCGKDRGYFELMARVAYWNKAVVHYSASGAFSPSECNYSTDRVPWIDERWTPELENIPPRSPPSHDEVLAHRKLLNDWYVDGNAAARFTDSLGDGYKGVGPHGFSVWAHSKSLCFNDYTNTSGCNAVDMRGRCHGEGGPHWMVKEASIYGKEGGRGANWHPPVGMHLLRGEILAYNYAYILLDAIYTVENDLKTVPQKDLLTRYQSKLNELQSPIPPAHHCKGECDYQQTCWTNYRPHFNEKSFLDEIIVGNVTAGGWRQAFKPGQNLEPEKYGYLDSRPLYEANGPGHEIYVRVSVGEAGRLQLCGYSHKESLKHAVFLLDVNATNIGPDYSPSDKRVVVEGKDSRRYIGDECTALMNLPGGSHVLTVRTDPSHPGHTTSLTHVVTYL